MTDDMQRNSTVRVDPLKPYAAVLEVTTETVWFQDHTIDEAIKVTEERRCKHVHLQTSRIDFLASPRLRQLQGVTIQFPVEDLSALYSLPHLTHLALPEGLKSHVDYSCFNRLLYLGGTIPKNYENLHAASRLKYVHVFSYPKADLTEFSHCPDLRELRLHGAACKSLHGLSGLQKLARIHLESCRKLESVCGVGPANASLHVFDVTNCKKLINANAIGELPHLKKLFLFGIHELDSLDFLKSLRELDDLGIHPSRVGVKNGDYRPLIEALQRLNKLHQLKGWKPLKDFLAGNTPAVKSPAEPDRAAAPKSDLQAIRDHLKITSWTEKHRDGLKQYSKENCARVQQVFVKLLTALENLPTGNNAQAEALIKAAVLELNRLNESTGGDVLETSEREELCELFDDIATAAGLDVTNYPDGIASQWRAW